MNEMNNDFPSVAFVANPNLHGQIAEKVAAAVAPEPADSVDSVEAAALLGVTANNLRQMVHKGQLSPVGKRGRRTVFTRADVLSLRERRSK